MACQKKGEQRQRHVSVPIATASDDICEFERQYTIQCVGGDSPFPIFRFLVYEKDAVKSPDDEFTLHLDDMETFGPIVRSEHTRTLEWRPNVFLTELNFFSVVDMLEDNECLALDHYYPWDVEYESKITIKYKGGQRAGGELLIVPPSRVFGWCAPKRVSGRVDYDSDARDWISQLVTANSKDGIELREMEISIDDIHTRSKFTFRKEMQSHVHAIAHLRPGNYIAFKIPQHEAHAALFFTGTYEYTQDPSGELLIVHFDKMDRNERILNMVQLAAEILKWKAMSDGDPELCEKHVYICLVYGNQPEKCTQLF